MSAPLWLGATVLAGTAALLVGWTGAFLLRRLPAWENALWRTALLLLLALPLALLVVPPMLGPVRVSFLRYWQGKTLRLAAGAEAALVGVKTGDHSAAMVPAN